MSTDSAKQRELRVCMGSGCLSSKSDQLFDALNKEVAERGIKDCKVKCVGCRGLCAAGPLVTSEPGDVLYRDVQPDHLTAIVDAVEGKKSEIQAVLCDTTTPFFTKQHKIVLENAGVIDPTSIDEYIQHEGYAALKKVVQTMTPQQVIDEVTTSQLRGRGGAGFPTGRKWGMLASSKSRDGRKFVICNGDEGDPGAFMDRSVMEADPHRILEGMIIAAYATGSQNGVIYVRAEYPLAVKRLQMAIEAAREGRYLGKNILGAKFDFDIEIRLGAGAFVCGEETALIASIEGKRGSPSPRPPFPTTSGLWGCPTMINNVETLANIPPIIRKGGAWYASMGTDKSKGSKIFALTGHVVNSGLIEVPMGTTLRTIVMDIGGGCPNGLKFKAVQTGGPSGGVIPAEFLDTPISYEHLQELGSIMGSGGMVVLDENDCMVDIAKFYLKFCVEESCGKCAPCRVGGFQMLQILEKITKGFGTIEDLDQLERISKAMQKASLCALGQTAPNPVLSTLRYFRHEYMAYIEGGTKYARQKSAVKK